MNKKADEVRKATDAIRKVIERIERRNSPLARAPLVQKAKELANLGDILVEQERQKQDKP